MNKDAPSAAGVSADAFVAISALVADYGLAIDAGDFERFRRIWARDAQFDAEPDLGVVQVPLVGRDAIVEAFETMRARPRDRRTRHYTMNLRLEPGEHGTVNGLSALLAVAMLKSNGSQVVHRTGWYRDVFAREDGAWRLQSRLLRYDVADPEPRPSATGSATMPIGR